MIINLALGWYQYDLIQCKHIAPYFHATRWDGINIILFYVSTLRRPLIPHADMSDYAAMNKVHAGLMHFFWCWEVR